MGLSDGAGCVYGSREAMSVETMVGEIVGTDSAIFIVFPWTKMLLLYFGYAVLAFCCWHSVRVIRDAIAKNQAREAREAAERAAKRR